MREPLAVDDLELLRYLLVFSLLNQLMKRLVNHLTPHEVNFIAWKWKSAVDVHRFCVKFVLLSSKQLHSEDTWCQSCLNVKIKLICLVGSYWTILQDILYGKCESILASFKPNPSLSKVLSKWRSLFDQNGHQLLRKASRDFQIEFALTIFLFYQVILIFKSFKLDVIDDHESLKYC